MLVSSICCRLLLRKFGFKGGLPTALITSSEMWVNVSSAGWLISWLACCGIEEWADCPFEVNLRTEYSWLIMLLGLSAISSSVTMDSCGLIVALLLIFKFCLFYESDSCVPLAFYYESILSINTSCCCCCNCFTGRLCFALRLANLLASSSG